MKHLKTMLILSAVSSLCACSMVQPGSERGSAPSNPGSFQKLMSQASTIFEEPVRPEKLAPNISSYYSNPAGALGGIYILGRSPGRPAKIPILTNW